MYAYSSQDWVHDESSINVYCLQLSQTLILPLVSHLPPHPCQEEQPGHVPPQHSTSRPPWRWSRRDRWAEPIREDREDSPPSSPGFDNPIRPHPASSPAHPLAPPDVLQCPESSWSHTSSRFTCPFYKLLDATSSGASSLGSSSVALCPSGRGQPSPISSQRLSQFCKLCLHICCLHQ